MAKIKNHKIVVQYIGTNYCGWQRQKEDPTIQGILEDILTTLFKKKINIKGAGRTDAGVHAIGQVANFFAPDFIPTEKLFIILNNNLPKDIRIKSIRYVNKSFDSQKSALSKIYRYQIYNKPYASPFLEPFCYCVRQKLNFEKMLKSIDFFVGEKDFTSFCVKKSLKNNNVRNVKMVSLKKRGNLIIFKIEANGFLHKMVRNIVGTIIEVGKGKLELAEIEKIFNKKNRGNAGPTSPAKGLFLERVKYNV